MTQISPSAVDHKPAHPPAAADTAASVSASPQHSTTTQELLNSAREHDIQVVDAMQCRGAAHLVELFGDASFFTEVFRRERSRHWGDRTDLWRPGLCMCSGSMVGVSSQMWVVKDVVTPPAAADATVVVAASSSDDASMASAPVEIEMKQCMTKDQAEAHAKLLAAENKGRTYKVELALDSAAAINISGFWMQGVIFTGKEFLPKGVFEVLDKPLPADGEDEPTPAELRERKHLQELRERKEVMDAFMSEHKTTEPLYGRRRKDVEDMSTRVIESISSIATAAQEHGAFLVSDFFVFTPAAHRRLIEHPGLLEEAYKYADREGSNILLRHMQAYQYLTIVVPMPLGMLRHAAALRSIFKCRKLVAVLMPSYEDGTADMFGGWRTPTQIMASVIGAMGKKKDDCDATNINSLAVVMSGGNTVINQMSECAVSGQTILVLHGSGRISDLWIDLWPKRAMGGFDPVAHRKRLELANGFPPSDETVSDLRNILARGDLTIHPITSDSEALQRLVRLQFHGDDLVGVLRARKARYDATALRYRRPQRVLRLLSLLIAFAAILISVSSNLGSGGDGDGGEDGGDGGDGGNITDVLYYVLVVLPALLVVVDSVDGFLRTGEAANAAERASGLVEKHLYMYRARACAYSDAAVAAAAKRDGIDLHTARQVRLTASLTAIDQTVADSGALVDRSEPSVNVVGDERLDGTRYMHERVEGKTTGALPRMGSEVRVLTLGALVGHIGLYSASAVGTVFATLEGLSRWVAVTVGFHHALSAWLQTFRVDERRAACHRAVSSPEGARVQWMSLPRELQTRQGEIDKLVSAVEHALEATLPPPPAHSRAELGPPPDGAAAASAKG